MTGHEQRDIACNLVGILNGHPKVNGAIITAIRALLEFFYIGQYASHDDKTLQYMTDALKEFHDNKQAILDAGARQGSHGELDHFNIHKLEIMKHVVPNIKKMGIANQYTSDITERYLIEVAKKPFHMSNHCDAPPQMVRALDRTSRLQISTCYFSWILIMPSILE